jgi:RecA/RadA recombinase
LLKTTSEKIIFIDTTGNFRPERIVEILNVEDSNGFLDRIEYIRVFSIFAQFNALEKIDLLNPRLIIVDTATSVIAAESQGAARHLILMKFLHRLAHHAIRNNCAVIITNSIREKISSPEVREMKTSILGNPSYKTGSQIEFMDKSTSISVHIKLRFEIINFDKKIYRMSYAQPFLKHSIFFTINISGISSLN